MTKKQITLEDLEKEYERLEKEYTSFMEDYLNIQSIIILSKKNKISEKINLIKENYIKDLS